MISVNPSSFGRLIGAVRRYPGGTEKPSIFLTLSREIPNRRAASRALIPSRWARRTFRYSSTVKMPPPSLLKGRAKVAEFYSAGSGTIPPLPWQTFPPPFSAPFPTWTDADVVLTAVKTASRAPSAVALASLGPVLTAAARDVPTNPGRDGETALRSNKETAICKSSNGSTRLPVMPGLSACLQWRCHLYFARMVTFQPCADSAGGGSYPLRSVASLIQAAGGSRL